MAMPQNLKDPHHHSVVRMASGRRRALRLMGSAGAGVLSVLGITVIGSSEEKQGRQEKRRVRAEKKRKKRGPTGPTGPTGPGASVTAGAQTATVGTQQQINVTSYGDLSTPGPEVTVTIPASGQALVTVGAAVFVLSASTTVSMSFQSTGGGGDVAASDERRLMMETRAGVSSAVMQASATYLVTGLSAGTHTFTAKYKATANAGTALVERRVITVVPVG